MIEWLKKNIFVLIFFCVGFLFVYYNNTQNKALAFYLKPFIAPTLIVSYLLNVHKKRNLFFIAILFFAFLGDVLFNLETQTTHILAMGSFLTFVLLLMIVISKDAKEITLNKLLLYAIPFLALLFPMLYFFIDYNHAMSSIYFITASMVAVLCAFSFYYYLKVRSMKSYYYFLGCMCFIIVGFTKMYNLFYGHYNLISVINNVSYIFSLCFFYNGAISKKTADIKVEL